MLDEMNVEITLETPVWTGGADKKPGKLLPGGIIGSMRFWYEVIQRGLGQYICDPTDKGCQLETIDEYDELCPVCKLFGCSGYKRTFKLIIDEYSAKKIDNDFYTFDKKSDVIYQSFHLQFINLKNDSDCLQLIKELLIFIATYGGIGAKIQYGFGKIRELKINGIKMDIDGSYPFIEMLKVNSVIKNERIYDNLYNLQNYFSCTFKVDNNMNILQNADKFKKNFKEHMSQNANDEKEKINEILFGDKKRAGTLFIALSPYKGKKTSVKFYGFIDQPERIKDILEKYIQKECVFITVKEILHKEGVRIEL